MNIRNESTIDTIPEVHVQAYGQSVYVSWTPVLVRSDRGYVSYELQVNASHEDVANEDQWHDPSQTDTPQYDTYVRLRETAYTDSTQRFFATPGTADPEAADPGAADPGAADSSTPSGTTSTIQRRVVPVHYRVRVVVETSDPVAIQDEDGNDTGETTNIIAFSEWSEAVTALISPLDYQDLNVGSISSDSFASESVISEHIKTGKIETNTSTNWEGENNVEGSEIDLARGSAKFRTYRPDEGSVSEVRISDDAASSGVVEHGIAIENNHIEGVAAFSPVRTEAGDLITQEDFPGWDFDDTWEMREGVWPKLQWQSEQTGVGNTEEAQGAHTLIRSAADLQKVRDDLDGNFRLENDIELSGAFEPIGSEENPFVGVFDGNGKTISGLQIAETDKAGFFAQIGYPEDDYEDDDDSVYQQGFVRNLNLVLVDGDAENPSIAGSAFAGAVAGRNYGRIEAVEVSGGSIQGSAEESRAGGIVGENSGYIKDVTISSNITASEADAVLGGVAGENSGYVSGSTFSGSLERDGQELTDVLIETSIEPAGITYELISSAADLQKIRDDLAGNFKLANDITLSGDFDPIGSEENPFVGILEGNGKTISGLQIAQADEDYVGFFARIGRTDDEEDYDAAANGLVRNLKLELVDGDGENPSITGKEYVGAVAGQSHGRIENCSAEGGYIKGDGYLGGLVGGNSGSITNSSASGAVDLSGEVESGGNRHLYLGGLVGSNSGSITNSSASGRVESSVTIESDRLWYIYIGGLVGSNSGSITNSSVSGTVELIETSPSDRLRYIYIGGLVGYSFGNITNSSASGRVELSGEVESGGNSYLYLGGLVGWNDGSITNSSASGRVELSGEVESGGNSYLSIGGLVGYSYGSIINSSASGDVSGSGRLGGLVGWHNHRGSITNSNASGDVSGSGRLGGLVGYNHYYANITNSSASGDVSGSGWLGGLVGRNHYYANITNSSASGDVSGSGRLGGLVGWNHYYANITNSSASGDVSGSGYLGGLVGYNYYVNITNSSASGDVSGTGELGGLVGRNDDRGSITNSSASGDVTGIGSSNYIGGLAGKNRRDIESSYAIGAVSGSGNSGGLVGENLASGEIQASYFDVELTGQSRGVGSDEGESSIGHYYSLGIPRLGETKLDAFGLAMASPYGPSAYGIHLKGIYPDQEESKERDLRISANTGISHTATVDGEDKMLHDTMHPLQTIDISYLGHLHWINSDAFSNNVTIYNNTATPRIAWTAVEALSIAGTRGVLVRVNASWYSRHNNTSELKVYLRPLGASWNSSTDLPVSGLQGSHWGSRNTQYVSEVVAVPIDPESRKFEFFTDYFGGTGSLNITQIGVYI